MKVFFEIFYFPGEERNNRNQLEMKVLITVFTLLKVTKIYYLSTLDLIPQIGALE